MLYTGISPLIASSHNVESWTPGRARNGRPNKSLFTLGLNQKSRDKLELKTVRQITANSINLVRRFVTCRRRSEIIIQMGTIVSHGFIHLHPLIRTVSPLKAFTCFGQCWPSSEDEANSTRKHFTCTINTCSLQLVALTTTALRDTHNTTDCRHTRDLQAVRKCGHHRTLKF